MGIWLLPRDLDFGHFGEGRRVKRVSDFEQRVVSSRFICVTQFPFFPVDTYPGVYVDEYGEDNDEPDRAVEYCDTQKVPRGSYPTPELHTYIVSILY